MFCFKCQFVSFCMFFHRPFGSFHWGFITWLSCTEIFAFSSISFIWGAGVCQWYRILAWLHHSRAANHYVLVVVYYAQGHSTVLLCSWSYHDTLPLKNSLFLFVISCMCVDTSAPATGCTCAFFSSVMLVVPQPISIRVLIQVTSCSIRFSSCSYASLPGETTSVFSHFKMPCRNEK